MTCTAKSNHFRKKNNGNNGNGNGEQYSKEILNCLNNCGWDGIKRCSFMDVEDDEIILILEPVATRLARAEIDRNRKFLDSELYSTSDFHEDTRQAIRIAIFDALRTFKPGYSKKTGKYNNKKTTRFTSHLRNRIMKILRNHKDTYATSDFYYVSAEGEIITEEDYSRLPGSKKSLFTMAIAESLYGGENTEVDVYFDGVSYKKVERERRT